MARPHLVQHLSDWVSPANRKLKKYIVDLQPDTLSAWKEAAARAGMSQRQATEAGTPRPTTL
jgi:hypothetical protein